jgi:hypothetical protein
MQWVERLDATALLRRFARALGLAVAVSAAAGCASLPDAGPFVDATTQYRSAIVASGAAIEGELREIRATPQADAFAKEWSVRIRAADALVAYSRSLAGIVSAGNDGAASARKVADSVQTLAGAAGIALPAAPVVGTVTDVAAFVYGQIASIRATSALAEAMQAAGPAVDQIATVMAKDLQAADSIVRAANEIAAQNLTDRFNDQTSHYAALVRERNALYKNSAPLTRQDEERLLQLDRLIAATRSWRDGQQAEEKAIAERLRATRKLIGATQQGLAAWALAHRDLAAAVAEGRKVDPAALLASIGEIRELVKRVQSL